MNISVYFFLLRNEQKRKKNTKNKTKENVDYY